MVVSRSSTRLVFIADFNQHDLEIHDCMILLHALPFRVHVRKNNCLKNNEDCIWGYENCLTSLSKFIFLALQLWIVKLGSNLFAIHGVVICHLDWRNSFVNIIIKLQPNLSTTAILGTKESDRDREAGWPSGLRVRLAIRRSWVQVPLWPLAGFVLGRPEFKSSATTGCLLPDGVLNPRMLYLN